MFTIGLCDDDELAYKRVRKIVKIWAVENKVALDIHCHNSGQNLIDEWENTRYDLLFLDIDMPNLNGVDTARIIRKNDINVIIVFLTGFEKYALTGYEVQAYRYILKPISKSEMFRLLDDAYKTVQQRRTEFITINMDGTYIKLSINDIIYIESFNHTVNIVTRFSTIKYNRGMQYMESLLASLGFARCHRSFLVNVKHITSLKNGFANLSNGSFVPVSRSRVNQIKITILHQPI